MFILKTMDSLQKNVCFNLSYMPSRYAILIQFWAHPLLFGFSTGTNEKKLKLEDAWTSISGIVTMNLWCILYHMYMYMHVVTCILELQYGSVNPFIRVCSGIENDQASYEQVMIYCRFQTHKTNQSV